MWGWSYILRSGRYMRDDRLLRVLLHRYGAASCVHELLINSPCLSTLISSQFRFCEVFNTGRCAKVLWPLMLALLLSILAARPDQSSEGNPRCPKRVN